MFRGDTNLRKEGEMLGVMLLTILGCFALIGMAQTTQFAREKLRWRKVFRRMEQVNMYRAADRFYEPVRGNGK